MFNARSTARIDAVGVHPDLRRLVRRAASIHAADYPNEPFQLGDVLRTQAVQAAMVASGASQTMQSRHLTGHAVDVILYDDADGDGVQDDTYDAKLPDYAKVALSFKKAAKELGIRATWGACWDRTLHEMSEDTLAEVAAYRERRIAKNKLAGKPELHKGILIDGPHFELDRRAYP